MVAIWWPGTEYSNIGVRLAIEQKTRSTRARKRAQGSKIITARL